MRTSGLRVALVALLTASAAAAPAAAQTQTTRQRAERALDRVERLVRGAGVETGRELTPALLDLQRRQRALGARDRSAAARHFARPTDGPGALFGYEAPEATPLCGAAFCIHYVTEGADAPDPADGDGDLVPDYVETMLAVFEREVRPCETGTAAGDCGLDAGGQNGNLPGQGWRAPPSDGALGGPAGRMDVYIAQLGGGPGGSLYGALVPDPGQTGPVQSSWQIMDDDYAPSEFTTTSGLSALRVTAAHEFHHAVQLAYDADVDTWMFESTATHLEDLVYPTIDDYLQYLAEWTPAPAQDRPMATSDPGGKWYATAVWNQWLQARFGPTALQHAWQVSAAPAGGRPPSFAAGAYDETVAAAGAGSFGEEFARFSAATAEWRLPSAGFRDLFGDVEREGSLPVDGPGATVRMDHTTSALFDVPRTGAASITLAGSAPAGTVAALALVGRTGSDTAGASAQRLAMLPAGGSGRVELPDAPTFDRITAVVVNADVSVTGGRAGTWTYARDDQTFTAAVTVTPPAPPAPAPPPPVPQPVADTTAPLARLALARQRLRAVLRRGLGLSVACQEASTITATVALSSRDARRLRLRGRLGVATGRCRAQRTRRLRIRLGRTARARLARHSTVRLLLAVRVADAAGNRATVRRTVTLRR